MYKIVLSLVTILSLNLFAYSDYDMDGVDDKTDICPNTPISDLVDKNGCTKKSLLTIHHFDIIVGMNYSQTSYVTMEDTYNLTSSIQLDYYYKNISLEFSAAYYDSQSISYNDSGLEDTFLGAYYKLNLIKNLHIKVGAGVLIPTYDSELNNNNIDYTTSIYLSYLIKNINIFSSYNFSMINDDNIEGISYQNTNSYSAGLGFYKTSKFYFSIAYNSSDSIYKGYEKIDTLSFFTNYSLNKNWFTTISHAHGLSETASDSYVSLRIGYYF